MSIYTRFHGPNAGYVMELYERYLEDPNSVDPTTRAYFEQWRPELPTTSTVGATAAARRRQDRRRRQSGPEHSKAWTFRRPARSARQRAGRGSDARPGRPWADRGRSRRNAGQRCRRADRCHGQQCGRCDRRFARHLLRHDRLRLRSRASHQRAGLAGRCGGITPLQPADAARAETGAAEASLRGRGIRAVPASRVRRPEAFLDRGDRHAGADARSSDQLGRRVSAPRTSSSACPIAVA